MFVVSSRRDCLKCIGLSLFPASALLLADDTKTPKNSDSNDPVYTPGGDISRPKLIHYVEPAFSTDAKDAFVEGVVTLSVVVTKEGLPAELHVTKGLNDKQNLSATEAVKQWRFQPGAKAGKPVNVRVNVEVEFHLL